MARIANSVTLFRSACPGEPTRANYPLKSKLFWSSGAQGLNRTADTVIFSHVLYQLSYLGIKDRRL